MYGKVRTHWFVAATVLVIAVSASATVQAQFFWDQQYQSKRTRPQAGGLFGNFFGRDNSRYSDDEYSPPQQRPERQHPQQPVESSRAPAPRKTDSNVAPAASIVVMGDDMADWLAYGLENVFSDSPEIGVVRKNKFYSGLLRYDGKSDLDWWHVARDTLAQEKADYVVMMLGLSDRQDIREKDLVKEAETRAKDQQAKNEAVKKDGQKPAKANGSEQKPAKTDDTDEIGAAAPQPGQKVRDAEFRSDAWAKIYSRRIDETIAALKSKGVPVIWVGLPPIRGARSTGDAAYLNDLYRARAERAGIPYIDVWDGFADEAGKYSNYGPDYEGQMRRLRLSDGVFFTKNGAIKLAHYVEHELRRYMNNHLSVALPSGSPEPTSPESKPTERPLAGPVIPLTGIPKDKESEELLGAPGSSPIHDDAVATKVLMKGETVAAPRERADNFAWPQGGATQSAQSAPPPPGPAQPNVVPDAATSALASAPAENKQEMREKSGAGKLTQKTAKNPPRPEGTKPKSPQDDVPRPPLPIGPSSGSFGRMR
jgi:hypothetical protein